MILRTVGGRKCGPFSEWGFTGRTNKKKNGVDLNKCWTLKLTGDRSAAPGHLGKCFSGETAERLAFITFITKLNNLIIGEIIPPHPPHLPHPAPAAKGVASVHPLIFVGILKSISNHITLRFTPQALFV